LYAPMREVGDTGEYKSFLCFIQATG